MVKPPRKTEQLTPQKILRAIDGTSGIICRLAERLGVARSTVYDYLERYPELKVALQAEKDRVDDLLEDTMLDQAFGGWKQSPYDEKDVIYQYPNTAVLIFMAKTRLRHRGYSEKQEIELSGNVDITNHYATASDVFNSLISETAKQSTETDVPSETNPRTKS